MKKNIIIEGVVAEYNGKFWGTQYEDAKYKSKDFGEFDKAQISNPKFCKKPTDMTWNPKNTNGFNPEYEQLKKARLLKVRKTITIEFEILN